MPYNVNSTTVHFSGCV